MNRLTVIITGILLSVSSFAQEYSPVDDGSAVKFKIKNLGFNVTGSFKGLQGIIHFDPQNLAGSDFKVSIDAKTINTGINTRDKHLRKEDYFDVEKHPRIQFVSVKVTPSTKAGRFFVFGKLTIKEVTKDISFPFSAQPKDGGYLFSGEFKINRRDFKVGGGSTVSDNLTVILNVLAQKA